MERFLKNIGRFCIVLSQKDEKDMRQNVLVIDGNSILPNNFALIIKGVKNRFRNAKVTVLTFKDKEVFIKDNFPGIEVVVPPGHKAKQHGLAFQIPSLLRGRFDSIVLSSLNISLITAVFIFGRSNIFLHNRWLEWYRLRQRTLSDVLHGAKSADRNRKRIDKGIEGIIKSFGRIFVILCDVKEQDLKSRILILDNGYTEIGYILTAVRKAQEIFINPDITLLTLTERKQDFINAFAQLKLVTVEENNNRNNLTGQMYRMRKDKFNYVILTTLDIAPILISFLFFRAKVMLYNQWHQWWSLRFRSILGYFKEILTFLVMIPVYIYLFIAAGLILFRTGFRSRLKFKSIIDKKK